MRQSRNSGGAGEEKSAGQVLTGGRYNRKIRPGGGRGTGGSARFCRRYREVERCALARPALHAHLAAVSLYNVLDNRQSQPGATLLARPRLVHPVKAFEDTAERFRW